MIKALFFDIDGTLVSFNTHEIPSSTLAAIAEAKAKGIKIFIATGRPKAIINNLTTLQEQELIDGYITMNGGYCFVGDEVIYKHSIPVQDVKALAPLSDERNFPCIFVAEHTVAVCNTNKLVNEIFHDFLHVDILPIQTTAEATQPEIFQMTPFVTTEEEKTILEETMAFGDGGNDISMLRHAAIGVAMGNANDDVKETADYITTSVDEDGIQKALKHFGII